MLMFAFVSTTADVESIGKNTEIYARVVRAEKTSKENDTSRIGLLFDFVKKTASFCRSTRRLSELIKWTASSSANRRPSKAARFFR